ncbi:MAG: DUF3825 domain-containing protein [Kiritimatiellae bacterium]|nr:DUF3825 domain-containing protein [Kiritimatiellia bacterium]
MITNNRPTKQRSCLYDIGWIRQKGEWLNELKNFAGHSWIDVSKLETHIREIIDRGKMYYDDNGNEVTKSDAKVMRIETNVKVEPAMLKKNPPKVNLEHDESCYVVIVFKRNSMDEWQGVDFDYGRSVKVKRGFYRVGYARIHTEDGKDVSWVSELCRLTGKSSINKVAIDELIESQMSRSYRLKDGSPANKIVAHTRVFRTGECFKGTKEEIFARFVRGRGNSWINLSFVRENDLAVEDSIQLPYENNLFRFAYFPSNWEEQLKDMALPEKWTLKGETPNGLLQHYLKNIYIRAEDERRVAKSDDNDAAAFDTGLVDSSYRPIYAYFVANEKEEAQPMKLKGFCFRGEDLGKEMFSRLGDKLDCCGVNWFAEHPERMHLDPDAKIYPDYTHCLIERAFRLPVELWESVLSGNGCEKLKEELVGIYQRKNAGKDVSEMEECWVGELKSHSAYDAVYSRISDELDSAIKLALCKVRYDYTTAVPIYYPTKHCFSFVLPLSFLRNQEIQCALVVERRGKGYQGHTILTSKMAYSNARLLKQPNEAWLRGEVED